MLLPRIQLGYETGTVLKLAEVMPRFITPSFDHENKYYEFGIQGKINPSGIYSLLYLNFEVAITESDGKPVLTTGLAWSMGTEPEYRERSMHSNTSFHTHRAAGGTEILAPSFGDVFSILGAYKTTHSVADRNGIMVYQSPIYDPDKRREFRGDSRDLVLDFCNNRGVNIHGRDSIRRNFRDLGVLEQDRFHRDFCEQTGMIVDEAHWQDKRGLERVVKKAFAGVR
jgi:hypothetical protein